MQVIESSIHKTSGFSSYFFHTLTKQRQKQMSPHRIRHSAITAALDATDGDVRKVQKLSRHKNLNTLMVYDDNRGRDQRDVTELLDEMF
ncbi:tyrosine-type recombinase/integrase [Microcoleus sp. B4-C5]|uniref:tyrosine-type recombinase/integrase n=1 Tax=unclassified Microcoleus TaxID=2642155 RepID=UPI002FD302E1